MKAYVTVMLKTTVLDPQGKTIHGALKKMGYKGLDEVRQENADLIVVPHTATRTHHTYETFYDTWPGWRWRWAQPAVVENEFRVGTLVVDLFDNRAKTAVWHGYASGVLSDEPSKNAEKADKAVEKLISEYPA